MTGPEHYAAAEAVIASPAVIYDPVTFQTRVDPASYALAQVHATLALAAATVVTPGSNAQVDWLKATTMQQPVQP